MKKHHALKGLVGLLGCAVIAVVILIILQLSGKGFESPLRSPHILDYSQNQTKNIEAVNKLVEIDTKKAITATVVDQERLKKISPILSKGFKGNIIVFLPEKTIIYDPLTNTIRDISSETFFKDVSDR